MRRCPKCDKELRTESVVGVEIDGCDGCGGVWLDRGEIMKLKRSEEDMRTADESFAPGLNNRFDTTADSCPVCKQRMFTFKYAGSSIEIETCDKGCGLWFDDGELHRVSQRSANLTPEARAAVAEMGVSIEMEKNRATTARAMTRTLMAERGFWSWVSRR